MSYCTVVLVSRAQQKFESREEGLDGKFARIMYSTDLPLNIQFTAVIIFLREYYQLLRVNQ